MATTQLGVTKSGVTRIGISEGGGGGHGSRAPVNVTLPVVTGIGQVGNLMLSALPGSWSGAQPISYAYQWQRDGVAIAGQTSQTYACVTADISHKISVLVTASNSVGSASATSFMPAFGLYSSTLGGSVQKLLVSSSSNETNHAKQSASLGVIAATIYTIGTPAEEGSSSLGTGIVIVDPNTLAVTTVVAPNSLKNNSNPIWSVIGDFFVYSTTNVSSGLTGGRKHVISSGLDTEYYAPTDINVSDFSLDVSNNLLMSGHGVSVLGGFGSALFIRAADTGIRYQLTTPTITGSGNPLGDFNPSWSPGGTMVACLRATAVAGVFGICVITVGLESGTPPFKNNGETIIAPPAFSSSAAFWGAPSWSSDGTLILSALYDPNNLNLNGVYSMSSVDGSMLSRIALRAEEYYNTPCFIPGGGSSLSAPILYATRFLPIFAAGTAVSPILEDVLDLTMGTIPILA